MFQSTFSDVNVVLQLGASGINRNAVFRAAMSHWMAQPTHTTEIRWDRVPVRTSVSPQADSWRCLDCDAKGRAS